MLKWTRFKYGGSHPEGLDRIDSASVPMRHTQSCKGTNKSVRSNPSSPRNRKNNVLNRSTSEIYDRRHSMENAEHTPTNRREVKSLILENLSSPAVNSPFVSLQWEELYKQFEHAHLNVSQQSVDEDVVNTTPKSSRQTSTNSLRRNSPTNLPCIEEAAENDELVSIADSGICDEDYDHKKHYFEPLKNPDDVTANKTNNNNETSSLKNFKKIPSCSRSHSLPSMRSNCYNNYHNNNNNTNINKNNRNAEKNDSSSSDESDSSSLLSFECSPGYKPTDINKNEELYTQLRSDLENSGMGQKKTSSSDDESDVSHSLM